jgi:dipeptidyl aminopeptidase/acylaminoacyl peptidase
VAIGEGNEQLVIVDSSGKRTDLVRGRYLGGYAWSAPDEIWFIRVGEGNSEIRAVTMRSRQRLLASMPGEFILQDVSGDGRVLLERDSESWETVGVTSSDPRERRLSWLDRSVVADLSADGRTILFSEIGPGAGVETAVYLRKTDGSPAVRLGDGQAVALSPNGKWALARLPSSQMILLPTGAGEAKPLPPHGIRFRYAGAFFPDGQRVLLVGNEPGRGVRLYVQDITGGEPRPITHEDVALGQRAISISSLKDADTPISPDGKYVAALNSDRVCSLYSVEGGPDSPPRQIPGLLPREEAIRWSVDGRSIFVRKPGLPEIVYRVDPRSGRKQIWKEFLPAEPIGSGAIVNIVPAPDGRSWAYTYNRYFSDLFLVEGLK